MSNLLTAIVGIKVTDNNLLEVSEKKITGLFKVDVSFDLQWLSTKISKEWRKAHFQ